LKNGLVGNVISRINKVNRRRARLILQAWGHPGQLTLAISSWVGAVSTSKSWDVNRQTA